MAEGLVNHLRGDQWEAFSAGTHPTGYVHPNAITAMAELGIDLSAARSKSVDEFRDGAFDVVLTVCDDAAEECPVWLGHGQRMHIGFSDPARGSLEQFRAVRDDIRDKVIAFLDAFERQVTKRKERRLNMLPLSANPFSFQQVHCSSRAVPQHSGTHRPQPSHLSLSSMIRPPRGASSS